MIAAVFIVLTTSELLPSDKINVATKVTSEKYMNSELYKFSRATDANR